MGGMENTHEAGGSEVVPTRKSGHYEGVGGSATATISSGIEQSFYRSALMSLIQLYIPTEAVQAVVAELGEMGAVQFNDLNPDVTAFQRTFTREIRKLDEMERKIRVLLEQASKEDVQVRSWISFGPSTGVSQVPLRGKALHELEEIEGELSESESRILQLDANQKEMMSKYLFTLEWHAVLVALAPHLTGIIDSSYFSQGQVNGDDSSDSSTARLDDRDADSMEMGGAEAAAAHSEANFVAGAIPKRKMAAFERVLWRALRGNVFVRSADCNFTDTLKLSPAELEGGAEEPKAAFVAYVHGKETLARLKKICEALGCTVHDVDPNVERRNVTIAELMVKLDDMYAVLFNTRQAKRAALGKVSESLEKWLLLVRKKKGLFDTMNKFSCDSEAATRRYFVAEGWCPTASLPSIDEAIRCASERVGLSVAPVLTVLDWNGREAPTHFQTNKLTLSFQEMTDSYGVGKYGEANPSLFMIISFPFLFAVMFGDLGHGLMMFLFSLWMVLDERRLLSGKLHELFEMIFAGRYIVLLMGIFSIFTGLIYNDLFSRALSIFPSQWSFVNGLGIPTTPGYTYPFGIDPAWALSTNSMLFLNSYKMKLSVLLGIVQMMFGLVISGSNFLHFGNYLDIYCTLIPQVLFMTSIFGYLCFLIIYKWIAGWDASILNTLIAMVLGFGGVDGKPIFAGQAFIQKILITIALICIPWMFLAKPVTMIIRQKKNHNNYEVARETSDTSDSNNTNNGTESVSSTNRKAAVHQEEHEMGEIWVHQLIHTIEFVLGSVSNTASYLRLWALSLAHAQLSDVLWQMTIEKGATSFIAMLIIFPMWFQFTVCILVAMEGMSAFLHALRLHWVEFNNKFYTGGGYKFEPFSISNDQTLLAVTSDSNKIE